MLGRGSRVVTQASEAEVGARTVEQSERPRLVRVLDPNSVGDLIAKMNQLVRGEKARQLGGADVADLDSAVLDYISVGNLAGRTADADADIIIAIEVFELVDEIVAEHLGPSDAGRIDARLIEPGKGPREGRCRRFAAIVDAQLGIGEGAVLAGSSIGRHSVIDVAR